MDEVIVDTNLVSFYFKRDPRADSFVARWTTKELGISFMTLAELREWEIKQKWGRKKSELLDRLLTQRFNVYMVNEDLCRIWAAIRAGSAARGRTLPVADAWIAATAIVRNAPLATLNTRDFVQIPNLRLF